MAPRTSEIEPVELQIQPSTENDEHLTAEPESNVTEEQTMSRLVLCRLLAIGLSFFVTGLNDGSLGALIPYIIRSYNISTGLAAIMYLTTFIGWIIAFFTNSLLTQYVSYASMLVLGAILQLLAHALRSWLPPLPFFAINFTLFGLGKAYQDIFSNGYVGGVKSAHRWLGFIHACYAGGSLVGPFVATGIASAPGNRWWLFYLFPTGLSVVNVIGLATTFRALLGVRWQRRWRGPAADIMQASAADSSAAKAAVKNMKAALSFANVWKLSVFYFFYLEVLVTANGWVVEYLVSVRGGQLSKVGYVSAGFNGGTFLGRLLLAEPTHRLGERLMLLIYCGICIGLHLMFWLIPNIIAASVAISVFGFFLGPFFAAGVSVASRLFSDNIKSSALGFVLISGQMGGNAFPAITGLVAGRVGVQVLQPILVGLLGATAVSWSLVPRKESIHRE
ncbi:major facilitator superfamily domain-containing protein [Elsinoe ampelina]|uniref:Major facilitator superfamily domain-containing protein n=1 Tax=Elsinoe ampelina TaxID=302913 RepID=A0A6A6GKI9_9PEZI|nr:major facilitator superfamily domain-containing protein [Elsinoe ampelina]